jgi:hypothetical protein
MSAAAALFFARGHLLQGLDAHRTRLVDEIEAAPEDRVLQVDEQQWAAALFERYRIDAPVLDRSGVRMEEPEPAQVDVSWEASRLIRLRPRYVPGHRTVVHVQFVGDDDIFQFLPSSHVLVELHARVGDQELLLEIEYPDKPPPDIAACTNKAIERVEWSLDSARDDISNFNSELHSIAATTIAKRRERIHEHRAQVAATGFPVIAKRDSSTSAIEELITRPRARLLPTARSGEPLEPEPAPDEEHYERILSVIRQQSRSMQRNPTVYSGKGEEDRRQLILDALNTHYDGAATAETFNFGGKTDIIITEAGRSLFVGECKFWSGAKGFVDTLDQLFGYQSWLDTRLAVLMFVRERDLTTIIERARAALENHPQFVVWQPAGDEQEIRATVRWKGDERRHADLNVFFIPTPGS